MKEYGCESCEELKSKMDAIQDSMASERNSSYDEKLQQLEEWKAMYECYEESCR